MNLARQWDEAFEKKLNEYLKAHLPELISKTASPEYEIEIRERIVRVEEALKNQGDFLNKMLAFIEKRFEQVDKRMESFEKRLEKLDQRMWTLTILVLASVLIPIILKIFFK